MLRQGGHVNVVRADRAVCVTPSRPGVLRWRRRGRAAGAASGAHGRAARRGAAPPAPEKAIVFSQWTGMLDLVERALGAAATRFRRLDGSMTIGAREAAIANFQARRRRRRLSLTLFCADALPRRHPQNRGGRRARPGGRAGRCRARRPPDAARSPRRRAARARTCCWSA